MNNNEADFKSKNSNLVDVKNQFATKVLHNKKVNFYVKTEMSFFVHKVYKISFVILYLK